MKLRPMSFMFVACMLAAIAVPAEIISAEPAVVEVIISPSVLILGDQGEWVSAHTDVPITAVDTGAGITLDGIAAERICVDAQGNMVGKFDQRPFEEKYGGGSLPVSVTLRLEGTYTDGSSFQGEDTITVRVKGKK